jgi:hypothetical protein
VVLSQHVTRYSHLHISACFLKIVAAERYLSVGRSRTASLVAVTISSADWNRRPRRFPFKRGKKIKSHWERSDQDGGCCKMVACCFASSSWTELCVGAIVHNSATMGPIHKITDCPTWQGHLNISFRTHDVSRHWASPLHFAILRLLRRPRIAPRAVVQRILRHVEANFRTSSTGSWKAAAPESFATGTDSNSASFSSSLPTLQ